MASSTIRKAIRAVNDQKSISLAKVSSNIAPDLHVAIAKATSHDYEPADEKYIGEILRLNSYSRGYVGPCVATSPAVSGTKKTHQHPFEKASRGNIDARESTALTTSGEGNLLLSTYAYHKSMGSVCSCIARRSDTSTRDLRLHLMRASTKKQFPSIVFPLGT